MTAPRPTDDKATDYETSRREAMAAARHAIIALRDAAGVPEAALAHGYKVTAGCVTDDLGRVSAAISNYFLDAEPALRDRLAAVERERDEARAEVEQLNARIAGQASTISTLGQVAGEAGRVMEALQSHGPGIVGHLLDDDDNAGERLRALLREVSLWALHDGASWRERAVAAEARLAAVEELFSGGPDTSCRTVWQAEPAPDASWVTFEDARGRRTDITGAPVPGPQSTEETQP